MFSDRLSICVFVLTAMSLMTNLAPPAVAQEVADRESASREYLGRRIARTMHYAGAPWLVRDSREREEEPAKLITALGLEPGMTVCDLGCGNGFYTLRLAERIGASGEVLAVDIQPEMLAMLEDRVAARRLENVNAVLGAETDPRLPAGSLDLVLLVDVYHEFSQPTAMLRAIHASLKPRGRVALVEFRAEDPLVPIKPLHKMTQDQCLKEFGANEFKLVGQYDELPWQHVLFFARDDSPRQGVPLLPWQRGPLE